MSENKIYKIELKKKNISRSDIIKYQLITFCFFNNISLTKLDIEFLVQLALKKVVELNKFCEEIGGENKIFSSSQSARNAINKAGIKKLIMKKGKNKKLIFINPELNLQVSGNILLDYKLLCYDS